MGPGESASKSDIECSYQLGKLIAQQGWILLTGGRNTGVMHSAGKGAKEMNGLTIGILPDALKEDISAYVDIPVITSMGNARNNINILTSDIIIGCGMSAGTASEISLALKAKKPVILINVSLATRNFFSELATDKINFVSTPEKVVALIKNILSEF